jgi:hypothetical protein
MSQARERAEKCGMSNTHVLRRLALMLALAALRSAVLTAAAPANASRSRAVRAALATERYYASYGEPTPLPLPQC